MTRENTCGETQTDTVVTGKVSLQLLNDTVKQHRKHSDKAHFETVWNTLMNQLQHSNTNHFGSLILLRVASLR